MDIVTFGLQNGSIYALIALGVVLVYKSTGVLNFAHGGIGAMGAFAAYLVLIGFDLEASQLPQAISTGRWVAATALALATSVVLALGVNLILRRLADASAVTSLVATAGVALLFISLQVAVFGVVPRPYRRWVPGNVCAERSGGECVEQLTLPMATVSIPWHTVVSLIVLAVAAALLALLFRTPPGIALLATAQDPTAARLQGVSVNAMTMLAWGSAGALAAFAGILGAGVFSSINPGYMLLNFLIFGFIAAVLGGITSLPGAVVGGLVLGILQSAANQAASVVSSATGVTIPGPPQIAVLVTLLAVLLLRPNGLLGREA